MVSNAQRKHVVAVDSDLHEFAELKKELVGRLKGDTA
jgi:hypothetical protein